MDLPIDATKDYTAAATDVLASITPVLYEDDNTLVSDMARIRFIHLSPNAPMVDVQVAGGPVLFNDVSFQESGGYVAVPGGTYDLEVVLSVGGGLALEINDITVDDNKVYTAYAMGLVGETDPNTTLQAVFSVDAVPEPTGFALLLTCVLCLLPRRRS